ncbi:MAG: carboxypeptidase-like regulatory domain-containing protein [Planctomycetota bacterium]
MLLLIAILIALGFAAYTFMSGPGLRMDDASAPREVPEVEDAEAPAIADPTAAEDGPRTVGNLEAGPAGDYSRMERVFDGTGMIFGEVRVAPGTPYPESWTLTLEPSLMAEGRQRAESRVIESEPGQRTFELRDLPMAAYRIRAEADGLASRAQEAFLFRIKGTNGAIDTVNADILLRPVAWVDGAIRTADGGVGDELPLYLVQRDDPDGRRYEALTNTAGTFRIDQVERGPWLLNVGDPVRPLVPSIPVNVDLSPVRLDDIVLPELATVDMVVVDTYGRPFPDVELVGYLRGTGSGAFRTRSDAVGRARVRYLTPGPWRVEAKYAREGQKGRVDISVPAGDPGTLHEIHIR